MTPKEKAQQLLGLYIKSHNGVQESFQLYKIPDGIPEEIFIKTLAKASAIATVHAITYELQHIRKIENTIFFLRPDSLECMDGEDRLKFWEEVVTQIREL